MADPELGPATFGREGATMTASLTRWLEASPDEVWAALSTPERLVQWLAPGSIDLRVGGACRHPRTPERYPDSSFDRCAWVGGSACGIGSCLFCGQIDRGGLFDLARNTEMAGCADTSKRKCTAVKAKRIVFARDSRQSNESESHHLYWCISSPVR